MQSETTGSRAKTILVIVLILLPLFLTITVKYLPALITQKKISAISIVPPRLYTPKEYYYLSDDLPKRLHDELADLKDIKLLPSPSASASAVGEDLAKVATGLGADTLIVTSVTIDAGMMQVNIQIIDPFTKKILYNTPFESPLDRYPDLMKAAGSSLKRALQP